MSKLAAAVAVAFLVFASGAQAHQPSTWSSSGHGPEITCSDGEAQMLTFAYWHAGLEPYPSKAVCYRRINPSAVIVRTTHYCFCVTNGVHDVLVNYDAHRYIGGADYPNRTWFSAQHVY